MEWHRGEHTVSTDKTRIDVSLVHAFLSEEAYWSRGRERSVVERSIEGSMCFGIYDERGQVGFARVVTDHATFAWVCDVFVLPRARGKGLSKWLMRVMVDHPALQLLRRWMLGTLDAHGLYEKVGFVPPPEPGRLMMRFGGGK
jgi:GNAT superfamily N-acetyltransferase